MSKSFRISQPQNVWMIEHLKKTYFKKRLNRTLEQVTIITLDTRPMKYKDLYTNRYV